MTEKAEVLSLFEAVGIELEYMIVDRDTLAVKPICDLLLAAEAGSIVADVERPPIAWSNELALHVVELKTAGPARDPGPLAAQFQVDIDHMATLLEPMGARLMPSAMHPFMDPSREMRLWPHDYNETYAAYDKIFDCRGHGYANLQSMHINLPFRGDVEFGRLHAAVRLLLPILPALAASSPLVEGQTSGRLDQRLEVYRLNSRRIPSVAGRVIPEPVYTRRAYEQTILERIYRDLAPFDPKGVLRFEFANARGAIARFDRDAIEIRVLDIQESPRADLAIASLILAVLRLLVAEEFTCLARQQAWAVDPLADLFEGTLVTGGATPVENQDYLAAFGVEGQAVRTVEDLWRHLYLRAATAHPELVAPHAEAIEWILAEGCLAQRILRALGTEASGVVPDSADVRLVYRQLCDCLATGELFRG